MISVTAPVQIGETFMLLVLSIYNCQLFKWDIFKFENIRTKFRGNRSNGSVFKNEEAQTPAELHGDVTGMLITPAA